MILHSLTRPLPLGAVLLASLVASPAAATILTFDIDTTLPASVLPMDQSYGDRVTALTVGTASYGVGAEGFTPNVLLSYQPASANLTRWTTGYGDLVNVFENDDDGDTLLSFTLTADVGFQAMLYGLDLGGYFGDYTVPSISAVVDGVVAFTANDYLVLGAGATHSSVAFAQPLTGRVITFRVDLSGLSGASDNIGIDNVRFGQLNASAPPAVPEPATWAMMIAGFALVGGSARRRRATMVTA